MTKARQFPGQEKQAFEYYTKDERAVASLRAPLFEDKVVEFIVSKADVKEVKKTTQEIAEIYEKVMADESEDAKPNKSKKEKK
jgi:trigger factor